MNKIVVEDGQTIWDLAIQEYGGVEDALKLVNDNGLSFSSLLQDGQILQIDETYEAQESGIQKFYEDNGYRPRTGESTQGIGEVQDGGSNDVLVDAVIVEDGGNEDILQTENGIKDGNS